MAAIVLPITDQTMMNWHMGEVLQGLYVGSWHDAKDHAQLDRFQITHIVAIHDTPRRLWPEKHYLCVMASDSPDQNLSQYFSIGNDFIHAARLREGNVLIHCLAGMSRSVTVAVAYIMTATHLNWKEALKVVRVGRAVANPNTGFQNQLLEFEQFKLSEERRRLRERFPSSALEQTDSLKVATTLNKELLQNQDICEDNSTATETNAHKEEVRTSMAYSLQFAVDKRKPASRGQSSKKQLREISESSSCGEEILPNVIYYKADGSTEDFHNEFLLSRNVTEIIEAPCGAGDSNQTDETKEQDSKETP